MKTNDPCCRLFVYGTLRHGQNNPMALFLSRNSRYLGQATFQGKLYQINNYPAALPSPSTQDRIIGDLFDIQGLKKVFTTLDTYEEANCGLQSEYHREIHSVQLLSPHSLSSQQAWVYIFANSSPKYPIISSGDFLNP